MAQLDTDILIIGAGISGIGAAYFLQKKCPEKTYAIHEGRSAIGGTWDLFRYPGIRSDSDMHTLGFSFKPWTEAKAIADGPNIRSYVTQTAAEYGITPHIRFETKVKSADWNSDEDVWTVVSEGPDGAFTTRHRFIMMCGGYYNYDAGYTPDFKNADTFKGQIIHPQHWPEDFDYTGKRVTIIGSGATAVTLVPAMAEKAAHVTMLQRSPTYVISRPAKDAFANRLRKVLPESLAYKIIRVRNVFFQQFFFKRARNKPDKVRENLLALAREEIGEEMVEKHFTPKYNPWDERLCLIPDSDLFNVLNDGKASVVTDHIDHFTETGIQLKSGEVIESDLIVTATGLELQYMNGVDVRVDGRKAEARELLNYKGVMLSNIPNMSVTFGYTNASWTLKADLTSEYVARLLNYMDQNGYTRVVPRLEKYPEKTLPFVDFSSGYFKRAEDRLPRQHTQKPWTLNQNYFVDMKNLKFGPIPDDVLVFSRAEADSHVLQAAE